MRVPTGSRTYTRANTAAQGPITSNTTAVLVTHDCLQPGPYALYPRHVSNATLSALSPFDPSLSTDPLEILTQTSKKIFTCPPILSCYLFALNSLMIEMREGDDGVLISLRETGVIQVLLDECHLNVGKGMSCVCLIG